MFCDDVRELIYQNVAAMFIQKNWNRISNVNESLIHIALEMEVWWDKLNCGILITPYNIHVLEFVAVRLKKNHLLQGASFFWREIILLTVRAGIMYEIRENAIENHANILRTLSAYKLISVYCKHRIGKRLRRLMIEYEFL